MSVLRYIRPKLREMLIAGVVPEWVERNPRREYVIAACLAAPPWVRMRDFKSLHEEAKFRTRATGILHVLDHIIPITHPLVCGLMVPWNIQVIDYKLNARKSNKLHYAFQQEMFTEPEQLRL